MREREPSEVQSGGREWRRFFLCAGSAWGEGQSEGGVRLSG